MTHHQSPSEHEEQVALFKWAEYATGRWSVLALLYAIPNGGMRPFRQRTDKHGRMIRYSVEGQKLRAEGVKDGVPDLCLPVPRGHFHGLYIEMKTRTGSASKPQRQWIAALNRQGYYAEVCHGWEQARRVIEDYLGAPTCPAVSRAPSPESPVHYPAPARSGWGQPPRGPCYDHRYHQLPPRTDP